MTSEVHAPDSGGDRSGPARPRHLARAPITEALIDFRVQIEEPFSSHGFDEVAERLADDYPNRGPIKMVQATVGLGDPTVRQSVEHAELGVLIRDANSKRLAQFRINGFTFNQLAPYTSWEEIYPETIRLWREYVTAAKPVAVVRLATRYINRLKFPLPIKDLREYLIEPPRVPDGLPQTLRGYLTRLIIHDPMREHSAIVTQSFEADPTEPERASILLDIDAFRLKPLKPGEHDQIELVLAGLHEFKNEIFFRSITQRASELFE